jgi:HEAT repeat protein
MNERTSRLAGALALAASVLVLAPEALPGDAAKDLKDKDVKVRMAAVEELEASGGKDAEPLLLSALSDRDWQVVERAADALGRKGSAACVDDLVRLSTDGPIRRIRVTAARAAGRLDANRAIDLLGKRINGDDAVHALEAVAAITTLKENEAAAQVVDDALKPNKRHETEKPSGGRERDLVRKAAAASLTAFPPAGRAARISRLMFDPDTAVACAAIDTAVEVPDPALLETLVNGLGAPRLDDCVERRLRNAIRAIVVAAKPEEAAARAKPALDAVGSSATAEAAARFARLAGDLAKAPPAPDPDVKTDGPAPTSIVPADVALVALAPAVVNKEAKARAAAAVALGKIRGDVAVGHLVTLGSSDPDAHVRVCAIRALAAAVTAKDARAFKVFQEKLSDADPLVREEAAVALGVKGLTGAVPSLAKVVDEAIADRSLKERKSAKWALGTVALVSLGLTEDPAACEVLRKAYADAGDWRLKASAVVGMGRVQKAASVPDLIDALDDTKSPSVHRVALEFLQRLTSKEVGDDSKSWREWWKVNEKNYQFIDRDAEYRKARKYGYAPTVEGLYQGLDVVVLSTRGGGDRIEDLLKTLKIEHRLCRAPQVIEANLHPYALFVANCPGEIIERDVEALSWFVRAGGYLFSSCWSLKEVIERTYPGMMRRFATPTAQVIDYTVQAAPCVPDDRFLSEVFDGWTRPMYVLEGAYLMEVLDRERVEVLIDSPDAAASWGCGNMAGWFTAGHGVVLDSVNHFSHQGFHFATSLKTDDDRAAYAMDHMGLTYADMRLHAANKVFSSSGRCEKEITDESAFRFLSNFVRLKRRVDL